MLSMIFLFILMYGLAGGSQASDVGKGKLFVGCGPNYREAENKKNYLQRLRLAAAGDRLHFSEDFKYSIGGIYSGGHITGQYGLFMFKSGFASKSAFMRKRRIVSNCTLIAAALLTAAALARAININNIVVALHTGDINTHYGNSVLIDWSLSAGLLMLVAVWLFFLSKELRDLRRRAWLQAIIIGAALAGFSAALWAVYPKSIHLPAYMLIGLIILVPSIAFRSEFRQ